MNLKDAFAKGFSGKLASGEPAGSGLARTMWSRVSNAFRENTYRAVSDLVFLGILIVIYPLSLQEADIRTGVVPYTLAVVALGIIYLQLPWERPFARWRWLPIVAYPLMFFVLEAIAWGKPHYLVIIHAAYLFGVLGSLYYLTVLVPAIFVNYLIKTDLEWGLSLAETLGSVVNLLFVGVASVVAAEASRRQKRTRALVTELESTRAELEAANAKLARRAADSRELAISEERSRMAREIHDTLGHYLTAVRIQLDAAGQATKKDPNRVREQIDRSKDLAAEALSEVRRSVRALKPLDMQEKSGSGALRALARSFEGTGRAVSFEVIGNERELSPETELVLYRAVQEGLTNALKHSGARRVHASLTFDSESVQLSVRDDGRGAPEGFESGGFGLAALKERAEALSGSVRVGNAGGVAENIAKSTFQEQHRGGFTLEVQLPARPSSGEALS